MPSYEVEHSVDLSNDQQDAIAAAVTNAHCTTFNALRIFMNIRFTNIATHAVYVAGKRVCSTTALIALSLTAGCS